MGLLEAQGGIEAALEEIYQDCKEFLWARQQFRRLKAEGRDMEAMIYELPAPTMLLAYRASHYPKIMPMGGGWLQQPFLITEQMEMVRLALAEAGEE